MAAALVVDVPHRQRRVVGVAGGERLDQRAAAARGTPASWGSTPAGRRARARAPSARHRQASRGCARENHGGGDAVAVARSTRDAAVVQQVQHPVEPAELVPALGGLQQRPGEDADADQVDPGLAHQRDVLGPDLLGPLLGVVVAAVADARRRCGPARSWRTVWPAELAAKSTRSNSSVT